MKKRTLSLVLAIVLAFSLSIPAFAATYSDLTGHWAEEYMQEMATKGFLTGYSDGTMKPEKNITVGETLVVLSRMYTLTDLETELIQKDYKATVEGTVSSSLSWEYKYLEICMAAGIITKAELKSIDLTADIEKEQLAVFLVRAMQLSAVAEKLEGTKLTFGDAGKITTDCFESVAELAAIEIVSGDDKGNFNPQSSVTRAVASTMISRSLSYLNKNSTTVVIADYVGIMKETGIIISASGDEAYIRGFDGLTREYKISSETNITVNNVSKALSTTYDGCYAEITEQNGTVRGLSIDSDSNVTWTQGMLTSITAAGFAYIKNLETGKSMSVTISNSATITRNGKTSLYSYLSAGDFITMKYSGTTVKEVRAVSESVEVTGTISSITLGSTVTMKVTDSKNMVYCYTMDISALPTIKRGDLTITVDRLKIGNSVKVTYADSKVTLISATGEGSTVTGNLLSTTTSSSGTVWEILADGKEATYTLDNGVAVYSGTTEISLSDVSVGDQVSVVIYDNTITEVYLLSGITSSSKITGTVLSLDSTNQVITILVSSNKLVFIKTASIKSTIVATSGSTMSTMKITKNSVITAYGAYSDTKTFVAKTIMVESLA